MREKGVLKKQEARQQLSILLGERVEGKISCSSWLVERCPSIYETVRR